MKRFIKAVLFTMKLKGNLRQRVKLFFMVWTQDYQNIFEELTISLKIRMILKQLKKDF